MSQGGGVVIEVEDEAILAIQRHKSASGLVGHIHKEEAQIIFPDGTMLLLEGIDHLPHIGGIAGKEPRTGSFEPLRGDAGYRNSTAVDIDRPFHNRWLVMGIQRIFNGFNPIGHAAAIHHMLCLRVTTLHFNGY